jgi:hypothetical protein
MKSGRQSVHWLWATDHLPFFWGIAPAFPPLLHFWGNSTHASLSNTQE